MSYTCPTMATITIRGIDDTLQHRLKMAAVRDKMTLKHWAIVAFERELHREEQELKAGTDKTPAKQMRDLDIRTQIVGELNAMMRTPSKDGPPHDMKACRIYGCGLCRSLGKKF